MECSPLEVCVGHPAYQHNPFVILCSKNATETTGDCYAMSFVYSGNFLAEVEVDQIEQTRMVMGIHPTQFSYQLKQGEVFDAPEVVMSYSGEGFFKNFLIHFTRHIGIIYAEENINFRDARF